MRDSAEEIRDERFRERSVEEVGANSGVGANLDGVVGVELYTYAEPR